MSIDSSFLKELHDSYHLRLLTLARRMIGNTETAEEVVQDAFYIINNKYSDFRGDSDIYTWMYRITCNLCLKAKGSLSKERIKMADVEINGLKLKSDFPGKVELSELRTNPEMNCIYKDLINSVRTECHFVLLGLLTKEQRIVYLMRTHEKMKFKKIGEILEISENAAKSRMNRALFIIEEDLKTRCSICNTENYCNCDDCAAYIIYKNPDILKKMREK